MPHCKQENAVPKGPVLVALFPVAGAALMLIFIGIHNAWDSVAYVAVQRPTPPSEGSPSP